MRKTIILLSLPLLTAFTYDSSLHKEGESTFADVDSSHTFYEAISYVQGEGIVEGYSSGSGELSTYRPDTTINRAEFTKIIIIAKFGSVFASKEQSQGVFSDITGDEWYAPFVWKAKEEGIVSGYPDGSFQAGNEINFAEAAKIVVNTFDVQTDNKDFLSIWWKPFVNALGFANAVPSTSPHPDHSITRGEMADIIYRLNHPSGNWDTFNDPNIRIAARYPTSLTSFSTSGEGIRLMSQHDHFHIDPCDFKGNAQPLSQFVDFDLTIIPTGKNLHESLLENESEFLVNEHFVDGTLKVTPDFIDPVTIGQYEGFRIANNVEYCGHEAYYFPIREGETLYINRKVITELIGYPEDRMAAFLEHPTVITNELNQRIFEDIVHSVFVR